MQQFIQLIGFNPHHGCLVVDLAFTQQVNRDFQHRSTGTFAVAGLQQPQFSILNGELDILHILVVAFQFFLDFHQLGIGFWHRLFEGGEFGRAIFFGYVLQFGPTSRSDFGNLLRGTNTGNHIFALGVDQVFSDKHVLSC